MFLMEQMDTSEFAKVLDRPALEGAKVSMIMTLEQCGSKRAKKLIAKRKAEHEQARIDADQARKARFEAQRAQLIARRLKWEQERAQNK